MTEAHVTVLGAAAGEERDLIIRVNGHQPNFVIKAEKLAASFSGVLDDRLSDFMDIVSCVFAADGRLSRGTLLRSGFGASWRRRMDFRIAVRDPDFWNRPEIKSALQEAILFMSDDTVRFEFEKAEIPPPDQGVFDFGPQVSRFHANEVILFSGGLDSLAGAYDRLANTSDKIILLSHKSANKRLSHAKALVDLLEKTFPGRILWVPVAAHLNGVAARETTQRTRSLLFACLGFVTARLSGASRLHFYENGIVSINLPISAQVIGTMASRTTHPRTLQCLTTLLDTLAPGAVALANPYEHMTKAEVAGRLANCGGADLIRHSVSCSHVRQQTILHPHCGSCSQCLDRRFGILAAGLGAYDPVEGYETDILVGARSSDDERILALDWARHALRLEQMQDGDFLSAFGAELARVIAARPDLPSAERARSVVDMHRRHGAGVRDALSQALAKHADEIVQQTLPATSLLRMIVADQAALPSQVISIQGPLVAFAPDEAPDGHEASKKVRISGSATSAQVIIEGLGEVAGVNATPAWALKPFHAADRQAERDRAAYRYVSGGDLATGLAVSKVAVRQRVKRLREDLALQHEAIEGVRPEAPLLIQSRGGRDYRLDPQLDILDDAAIDPRPE